MQHSKEAEFTECSFAHPCPDPLLALQRLDLYTVIIAETEGIKPLAKGRSGVVQPSGSSSGSGTCSAETSWDMASSANACENSKNRSKNHNYVCIIVCIYIYIYKSPICNENNTAQYLFSELKLWTHQSSEAMDTGGPSGSRTS